MRSPILAILAAALLAMSAGAVLAAAPTAAQKAEFRATCLRVSGNEELCTCKAEAAMTLIDERFMGVVIASMQGGAPAAADYETYNSYVARSNQLCKPNY
ncbi:MAG TPA: hypothetical protein VGN80_04375 [Devosiaceae bacterium]|jgi:hypothetical protein|nr:hypothetical protein [Devosiaceae bacterium]